MELPLRWICVEMGWVKQERDWTFDWDIRRPRVTILALSLTSRMSWRKALKFWVSPFPRLQNKKVWLIPWEPFFNLLFDVGFHRYKMITAGSYVRNYQLQVSAVSLSEPPTSAGDLRKVPDTTICFTWEADGRKRAWLCALFSNAVTKILVPFSVREKNLFTIWQLTS